MTQQDFWMRAALPSITAVCEATFPENDCGAPDFRSTHMVERTLEYLDELPPEQRRLLLLLFLFVQWFGGILAGRFGRFSRLRLEARTGAIRRWRSSSVSLLRMLGDAIKATTTMMYMSHPSVLAHIGEYRVCDWPSDPLKIDVRPDALRRQGGSL